ncbi:MAG: hypothetical protein Q9218_004228 [Villophora microphyllina]
MKFTSTIAAMSVLGSIVMAAPAPVAFNDTAFDQVVKRQNDYTGGTGKSGLQISTFKTWHCQLTTTLHQNVQYDHNYADGTFMSYSLSRDLKPNEMLDFSGKVGGTTKRDETGAAESSPRDESPLEKRKIDPECASFFEQAPRGTTAGCHNTNVPAGCFRLWRRIDLGLFRPGKVGIPAGQ